MNEPIDRPMVLGDHLEELRTRLIKVAAVVVLGVLLGFAFHPQLKALVEMPLRKAVSMVDSETIARLKIETDPNKALLKVQSLAEPAINAVKISFFAAIVIAFPILVYQIWQFVIPGLQRKERRAGFLLMPAAVVFFYGGVVFGFFIGLPYFYKWLMEFAAADLVEVDLRQSYYHSFFIMMTVCFGAVMDIPWLVMVLVRARVVTPAQLASKRKIIILVSAVLAAVLSPPDPFSQLMLGVMMICLFEIGLIASRILYRERTGLAVAEEEGEQPLIPAAAPALSEPEVDSVRHEQEDFLDDEDADMLGPVARPSALDRARERAESAGDADGEEDDEDESDFESDEYDGIEHDDHPESGDSDEPTDEDERKPDVE